MPGSGTVNAQQLKQIIDKAETFNIISKLSASVGEVFSVSLAHAVAAASPQQGFVAPVAPLSPGEAQLVSVAVNNSNAAAKTTPSAASGTATAANTPGTTISNVIKGIATAVDSLPEDIRALEAGAVATLHWWGWELVLNESATKAFSHLLTTDIEGLVAVAAALAPVSAPLAAVSGIVSATATAFNGWVTTEDSGNGVTIDGYLWVGVWVEGTAPKS